MENMYVLNTDEHKEKPPTKDEANKLNISFLFPYSFFAFINVRLHRSSYSVMSFSFNIKSPSFWVPLTVTQNGPSVSAHRERYTGGCVLPSLDCTAQHCSHSSVHVLSKTSSPSSSPTLTLQNRPLVNPSAVFAPEPWARQSSREHTPGPPLTFLIMRFKEKLSSALRSYWVLLGLGGVLFPSFRRGCLSSSPSSNFSYTSLCHPILPFSWWFCYFILYLKMSYEAQTFLISMKSNLPTCFFGGVCFWCHIYNISA